MDQFDRPRFHHAVGVNTVIEIQGREIARRGILTECEAKAGQIRGGVWCSSATQPRQRVLGGMPVTRGGRIQGSAVHRRDGWLVPLATARFLVGHPAPRPEHPPSVTAEFGRDVLHLNRHGWGLGSPFFFVDHHLSPKEWESRDLGLGRWLALCSLVGSLGWVKKERVARGALIHGRPLIARPSFA
jgi:hypothetical protein